MVVKSHCTCIITFNSIRQLSFTARYLIKISVEYLIQLKHFNVEHSGVMSADCRNSSQLVQIRPDLTAASKRSILLFFAHFPSVSLAGWFDYTACVSVCANMSSRISSYCPEVTFCELLSEFQCATVYFY